MELNEQEAAPEELEALFNSEWIKSEILIRTTNWRDLSYEQKEGVILHEIGHALKLRHVSGAITALMQDQMMESYNRDYITVYDMCSLISKWGA